MVTSEIRRNSAFSRRVKLRVFLDPEYLGARETPGVFSTGTLRQAQGWRSTRRPLVWQFGGNWPRRPAPAAPAPRVPHKNRRIERPRTGVVVQHSVSVSVCPQHGEHTPSGPDLNRAALPHARASRVADCTDPPPPSLSLSLSPSVHSSSRSPPESALFLKAPCHARSET